MSRKTHKTSVGGQALIEGVMMQGPRGMATAVRKPDGEIEVELEYYQGVLHGHKIKELPFIRGIFNFVDSTISNIASVNDSLKRFLNMVEIIYIMKNIINTPLISKNPNFS